jgi:hypothetical protein
LPIPSRQRGRLPIDHSIFIHRRNAMEFTIKLLGFACAALTVLLWAIIFWTDPAPGAIITAAALTIVTVIAGVLTVLS